MSLVLPRDVDDCILEFERPGVIPRVNAFPLEGLDLPFLPLDLPFPFPFPFSARKESDLPLPLPLLLLLPFPLARYPSFDFDLPFP